MAELQLWAQSSRRSVLAYPGFFTYSPVTQRMSRTGFASGRDFQCAGKRALLAYYLLLITKFERTLMGASGELIRMMNYIDDIAATLRRVSGSLYLLSDEEKKRLGDYMRKPDPNFVSVLAELEPKA